MLNYFSIYKLKFNLAGNKNKGGIIISSDNGSSWSKLRDQRTYSMEVYNGIFILFQKKGLVAQTYGKFSDHLMQVSHGQ